MKKLIFFFLFYSVLFPVFADNDNELWDTDWSFNKKYSVVVALHQGFIASFGLLQTSGLSRVIPATTEGVVALKKFLSYVPGADDLENLNDFNLYVIDFLDTYFEIHENSTLGGAFQEAILAWNNSGKYTAGYKD